MIRKPSPQDLPETAMCEALRTAGLDPFFRHVPAGATTPLPLTQRERTAVNARIAKPRAGEVQPARWRQTLRLTRERRVSSGPRGAIGWLVVIAFVGMGLSSALRDLPWQVIVAGALFVFSPMLAYRAVVEIVEWGRADERVVDDDLK